MAINFIKKLIKNNNQNHVLLAQFFNAVMALISGKLIAIYIIPEDFGTYNIQWASLTFFSSFLISPLLQYMKTTNNTLLPKIGSRPYIITAGFIIVPTYIFLVTFLYFYYKTFDFVLFSLMLFFISLSTIDGTIGNYLNVKNKLIDFSKLSILKSFSSLVFIAFFFFIGLSFLQNVEALWMMQVIGVLFGITFYISNYKLYTSKINIAYSTFLKKYYRFAAPLMFLAIWTWVNNYFDRYAIDYFLSIKEVGIYNASYSVGSKFFLLLSPVFMILLTPLVYAVTKNNVKKLTIKKYGLSYFILGIPILAVIYFSKDLIGGLLLSENYKDGFSLIFWIALAYFILTLTQLFELLFYAEQKTKVILIGNILSALVNILLNILLIPKLGLLGAAMATCCGFTIHLIVVYYYFNKL